MKRIITYSMIALLQASVAFAQTSVTLAQPPVAPVKTSSKPKLQKREKYEWQGEIPTYVEMLKKELTYPMAWGNSLSGTSRSGRRRQGQRFLNV